MKIFRKMPNVELNEYFYQKKWTKNVGCRIKRERIFTAVSLRKQPQITFFTLRFAHKGTTLRIRKVLNQLNFSPRITCESHFVNSNDLLVLIQCDCFLSAPECWCDISKISSPVMNTLWFTLVFDVELNECRIQKKRNLDVELSN